MKDDGDVQRLSYEPSPAARAVRATALGRGTHGVPDVRRLVETQFHVAFPHRIWVAGQVGSPAIEDDGSIRFPLHSSTTEEVFALPCVVPGGSVPELHALLQRGQDADLDDVVREGRLARVGGLLRYDAERGSLAFLVSDLDSTPTALGLAEEREQALQQVVAAGLVERQHVRGCLTAPMRVAVVGDERDATLTQVHHQLTRSGFGVQVQVRPVTLMTPAAPRRLAEEVRSAADSSDVVLLVRAEGRPLRLATYDAPEVARAVADAPVPVVTGLGGGGVRTTCDAVAFTALPSAPAAADWVLTRLREADTALKTERDAVATAVAAAFGRARQALDDAQQEVTAAAHEAAVRAEAARGRRRLLLFGGCALLVALVIAAAMLTGRPLLLVLLLVPAAVLLGAHVWSTRARTTGSRRMTSRDDDFARVLERLRGVRDELAGTSSPEKVAGLRDLAEQLVEQGQSLLGRHVAQPAVPARPAAAAAGNEPSPDAATQPTVRVTTPPREVDSPAEGGSQPTVRVAAPPREVDSPAEGGSPGGPDAERGSPGGPQAQDATQVLATVRDRQPPGN